MKLSEKDIKLALTEMEKDIDLTNPWNLTEVQKELMLVFYDFFSSSLEEEWKKNNLSGNPNYNEGFKDGAREVIKTMKKQINGELFKFEEQI